MGVEKRGTDTKFLSRIIFGVGKGLQWEEKETGDVSQASGSCMCKLVVLSFFPCSGKVKSRAFYVSGKCCPNALFVFY